MINSVHRFLLLSPNPNFLLYGCNSFIIVWFLRNFRYQFRIGNLSILTDNIALRGYENGSLTPYGSEGYAYVRLGAELRYPLMLENSTSIYALGFIEGGNAWTDVSKFNPFQLKRSAGVGVRIFLPMIGMMGIDWAYGFDKINGSSQYSGSQFHFILGQEF